MKKKLVILISFVSLCFFSCEKDNVESPGNISGMGDNNGELEITEPFSFPEDINLLGEIIESVYYDPGFTILGSGNHIELNMTLLNTSDVTKTIYFPRGLIFKNSSRDYHNGILLQTSWVTLEANSQRKVKLQLYCINKAALVATVDHPYSIIGISGSPVMQTLIDLVRTRKINYEMYYGSFNSGKSENNKGLTYEYMTAKLQDIVWNLTDFGVDISDQDRAFINSIPQLSPSEIPPEPYPDTFPEFVVTNDL